MKTLKITATIGIQEGYQSENLDATASAVVSKEWQKAAETIFNSTGIYVSAVIKNSLTVYHTDWGCPVGGEKTAEISTSANPAFVENLKEWQATVIQVIKLVKESLKQSTVVVEVQEVSDFIYLN